MNRKLLKSAIVFSWWFANTWPTSQTTTLLGPFRSLSQCNVIKRDQVKLKSKAFACFSDGETLMDGWQLIITGISDNPGTKISLTGGAWMDQATCEEFRASVNTTAEDGASICWPTK